MKTVTRQDINPIRMSVSPHKLVASCGMRIIDLDGHIMKYVGIGWIKEGEAKESDYLEIPQLID